MAVNAIGLGEMTVKSSLDQPFLAEIELLDVGSSPVVGIKVAVADPDNFQQLGLERVAVLSLLHFNIEKNVKGKFVIKVQSRERMSEPYMELVVDLTWPGGQLYKAYTVLLDPPGYQLVSTRAHSSPTYYKKSIGHKSEPGVIEKAIITEVQHNPVSLKDSKKQTTYGPTIANENVWQIAQRYKASEVILPQVVLAIVGVNPNAFTEGNLNGLKVGVRLTIPATNEIAKVPAELATAEVMAHDKAWNEKTPINHVLSPPYTHGQVTNPVPQIQSDSKAKSTEIPTIPKFTIQAIMPNQNIMPQLIPSTGVNSTSNVNQAQPAQNNSAQHLDQNSIMKTELSITSAAVESVRESNALLMEQLHLLQDQNKNLQKQLTQRDKEMKAIRTQMQTLMKQRLAVSGQVSSPIADNQSSSFWTLVLLLVVAAGGGGFAYWYFKLREKETKEQPFLSSEPIVPKRVTPEVTSEPVKAAEVSIQEAVTRTIDITAKAAEALTDSAYKKLDKPAAEIEKNPSLIEERIGSPSAGEEHITLSVGTNAMDSKTEITAQSESSLEPTEIVDVQSVKKQTELTIDNVKGDLGDAEVIKKEEPKEEPLLEFESSLNKETDNEATQIQHSLEDVNSIAEMDEPEKLKRNEQKQKHEESSTNEMLEFEPGLHQILTKQREQEISKPENTEESDNGIDFVPTVSIEEDKGEGNQQADSQQTVESENNPSSEKVEFARDFVLDEPANANEKEEIVLEHNTIDVDPELAAFFADSNRENSVDKDEDKVDKDLHSNIKETSEIGNSKTASPLKSKAALDTLLALANTYISMDDLESAKASLDEVLEHGSEKQKTEALRLLNQIKEK